jgi:hypothetical protein
VSPGLITRTLGRTAERVPGFRRIPVVKLLSAAEIVMLAREHMQRLTAAERRRLLVLVRVGRGRRSRLTESERGELEALLAKVQPRLLVGEAVDKLSPVPLPRRLVYGRDHDGNDG